MKPWRWVLIPPAVVLLTLWVLPPLCERCVVLWFPPPGYWKAKAMRASNPEKAVQCFGRAIEQDPDDHEAYWRRGMSLAALGRLDEAIVDVTTAIRMAPKREYLQNLADLQPLQAKADQKKAESLITR